MIVVFAFALEVTTGSLLAGSQPQGIRSVSVSKPFFNPTLGQTARISFVLDHPGKLDLLVLDRDGVPIRTLVSGEAVQQGAASYDWDGRDDDRMIVPNESYSFKIDLAGSASTATYFPAARTPQELQVRVNFYDRLNGTLGFELPSAARVHLQAGTSKVDPRTKRPVGPSLKTLVNREPRPEGSVLEHWDGFDESGLFYVPELPTFAMSLVATSLPENSVIAVGNSGPSFIEYAGRKSRKSLFPKATPNHRHHHALTALEDSAPRLALQVRNAAWSEADKAWISKGDELRVIVTLEGPSAATFAKQPGGVVVFVGDDPMRDRAAAVSPLELGIPLSRLSAGVHRVTANWISDFGSVAVNSVRIRIEQPDALPLQPEGR